MADASALVISSPHTSLYMRRNSSSRSGETWWPVGCVPDGIYFCRELAIDSGFCHGGNIPPKRGCDGY
jgi:hypothetical protein